MGVGGWGVRSGGVGALVRWCVGALVLVVLVVLVVLAVALHPGPRWLLDCA